MIDTAIVFENINKAISYVVFMALIVATLLICLLYTGRQIKQEGMGRGIFLGAIMLIEGVSLWLIIGIVPELPKWRGIIWLSNAILLRWILLYFILSAIGYLATRKKGGGRGLSAVLLHLTVLLIGWSLGNWVGIIFISLPLLGVYYWIMYLLAQVILPAADPDDKQETGKKFSILAWYFGGLQFPLWIVNDSVDRLAAERIKGDYFKTFGTPGLILTHSHQAIGISTGITFNRVEGPGVIFTGPYERPVSVVDLRTQLRTTEVDAVLRDGIEIKAILFASFGIDRRDWSVFPREKLHEIYRVSPILRKGLTLDHTTGSYPYSSARVHAAMGTSGLNTSSPEGPETVVHWDEWALQQVQQVTRQVLSERSLDGLWEPNDDGPGISALDEIGAEIIHHAAPHLETVGIHLFGARVVNFNLESKAFIVDQKAESWKVLWDQRAAHIVAEGRAESGRRIEEAKAHVKARLMESIAGSLERARTVHPDLPRHIIALNLIASLEEYLKGSGKELEENLKTWKETILMNKLG